MKILQSFAVILVLSTPALAGPREAAVVQHYTVMAHALYEDSLITARALKVHI